MTTTATTSHSESEIRSGPSSLSTSLAHLTLQNQYYAKIHIQNNAFIVTQGDLIHLPFRLSGTRIGDVLRIVTVSSFGSRDYTLTQSASPSPSSSRDGGTREKKMDRFLKGDVVGRVECRVTVVEHTKQPLFTTIKKKRRNRHAKAHTSKQPYTVLRVSHLALAQ